MEKHDNNGKENMTRLPVSVIILTYNEEENVESCLKSICELADEIFVIDSGSTDSTLEISKRYTDKIFYHRFENHSKQLNWALRELPIKNPWIMRIDADEFLTAGLSEELSNVLPTVPEDISGLMVKRRVYFMGRWIRHGGYYPTWLLRIWRKDCGTCEELYMDEHIKLNTGKVKLLSNDIVDDNHKDLSWWINKHNNYATSEVIDIMNNKFGLSRQDTIKPQMLGTQDKQKRWAKERIYLKLPLFLRAFLYYLYRYFLKLGILDGKEGLIWHFLQGFWYRFLVDAKIFELYKESVNKNRPIKDIVTDLCNQRADDEKCRPA